MNSKVPRSFIISSVSKVIPEGLVHKEAPWSCLQDASRATELRALVHAAHTTTRHWGSGLILRLLDHHTFGGQEETGH